MTRNILITMQTFFLSLLGQYAASQDITDLHFEQVGKTIEIHYNLVGKNRKQLYNVGVFYKHSDDGDDMLIGPLQKVSGHVGAHQKSGDNKTIVWDVLQEIDMLTGNIIFSIKAIEENTSLRAKNYPIKEYKSKKTSPYFINFAPTGIDLKEISNLSTLAITLGHQKKTGGWYLRGKINLKAMPTTSYETDNIQIGNYNKYNSYYIYNEQTSSSRFGLTGGLISRWKTFSIYGGVGYGTRDLYWGIDEFYLQGGSKIGSSWAKHKLSTVKGLEIETGILLRLGFINIMGGLSLISYDVENATSASKQKKEFIDSHFGIGINF